MASYNIGNSLMQIILLKAKFNNMIGNKKYEQCVAG